MNDKVFKFIISIYLIITFVFIISIWELIKFGFHHILITWK